MSLLPPKIAKESFKKINVPDELYSMIMLEYKNMSFSEIVDNAQYDSVWSIDTVGGISNTGAKKPYYFLNSLSTELYDECFRTLTPILEEWSGVELEKTWGYGIRSYPKNSILHLHRDRYDTHIISCIIFVDDSANEKWPLDFFDHEFNHHKVSFDHQEMLMYESLCVHGRITPFSGNYYRNMYFHWKPKQWDVEKYKSLKTTFRDVNDFLSFYGKCTH